jgi:hypothetical protein
MEIKGLLRWLILGVSLGCWKENRENKRIVGQRNDEEQDLWG